MSDQAIRDAAGHIIRAANMIERTVAEVLVAFREGHFDPEPVGSSVYVRRLRDQYTGQVLGGLSANTDGAKATAEMNRGTDITEVMGVTAREFANAAVRALGYQIPEDPPAPAGPHQAAPGEGGDKETIR